MAGKGSRARPLSVSKSKFDDNWDRIFGKKETPIDTVDATNEQVVPKFNNTAEEVISNSSGSHA